MQAPAAAVMAAAPEAVAVPTATTVAVLEAWEDGGGEQRQQETEGQSGKQRQQQPHQEQRQQQGEEDLMLPDLSVPVPVSGILPKALQGDQQHQQEELLLLDLPVTGNLGGLEVLPVAEELQALLQRAMEVACTLAARRPHVINLDKMARRIRSDLDFVRRCCPAAVLPTGSAAADAAAVARAGAAAATVAAGVAAASAGAAVAEPSGNGVATPPAATTLSVAAAAAAEPDATATAIAVAVAAPVTRTGAAGEETQAGAAVSSPGHPPPPAATADAVADVSNAGRLGDKALGPDAGVEGIAASLAPAATAAASRGYAGGGGGSGRGGGGRVRGDKAPPPLLPLTPERVQGIINNLRGFQGELLAAQLAPDVVGVLRHFQARVVPVPPDNTTKGGKQQVGKQQAGKQQPAQQTQSLQGQKHMQLDQKQQSKSVSCTAIAGDDGGAASAAAAHTGPGAAVGALVGQKRPLPTAARDAGGADDSAGAAPDVVTAAASTSGGSPAGAVSADVKGVAKGGSKAGGGKGGGGGGGLVTLSVEVDVVAQGGHCWIEVKCHEVFGLDSIHWTGAGRAAGKGLRRQVEELLAVAAAPQHQRRWRPPAVVLFFPSPEGVHPNVARELRTMGVHVAVGPDALRCGLPAPPPLPATTNLDVTTMCGLVSEMSHGGADDPGVQQWAERTVHWVECLAAERAVPLLSEIGLLVAPHRPLLAADLACRQFQVLLDMFGGPRERARWEALQARMTVVATEEMPEELSERCRALLSGTMGRDQLAVFGLGDGRRAVTLSANGNAVRGAERQGVALEVVLHRPVWLTGR